MKFCKIPVLFKLLNTHTHKKKMEKWRNIPKKSAFYEQKIISFISIH